jgi:cell division septation protein DedD
MPRLAAQFILALLLMVPVLMITVVLPRLAEVALELPAAATPGPVPVPGAATIAPPRPTESTAVMPPPTLGAEPTVASVAPTPAPSPTPQVASPGLAAEAPARATPQQMPDPTPVVGGSSGEPAPITPAPEGPTVYVVQIAAHATREAAEARQDAAQAQGVQAQILPSDRQPVAPPNLWLVYVGPFEDAEGARAQAEVLRVQGYGGAFVREVRL